MDRLTCHNLIKFILSRDGVVEDLVSCLFQKTKTTKLVRKERALAHILDNFTGDITTRPGLHDSQRAVYDLAEQLKARTTSTEVQIACDRVMARMKVALSEPEFGTIECVACGEKLSFNDHDHHCNPEKIRRKDTAMTNDDTVKEIS